MAGLGLALPGVSCPGDCHLPIVDYEYPAAVVRTGSERPPRQEISMARAMEMALVHIGVNTASIKMGL